MLRVHAFCVFVLVFSSCLHITHTATAKFKFKVDTSVTEPLKKQAKNSVDSSVAKWKASYDQSKFGVKTYDGVISASCSKYPSESIEVRGTVVSYRLYYSEILMKWGFKEKSLLLFGIPIHKGMGYRYFKIRGVSITVEHRVSKRKSSNNQISVTASTHPTVDWRYHSCDSTGCSRKGSDFSLSESTFCRMLMSHIKDNLSRSMRYQLNNRINSKILKLKDGMPSKYTYGTAWHTLPGAFGNTYSLTNAYWNVKLKQYNGNIYVLAAFSSESNSVSTPDYQVTSAYDVEWSYGNLDLSQFLSNQITSLKINKEDVLNIWKTSQIVAPIDCFLFNLDITFEDLHLNTSPGKEHATVTLLVSESPPQRNKLGQFEDFLKIYEFKPKRVSLILPIAVRPSYSECKHSATLLETDVDLADFASDLLQAIGASREERFLPTNAAVTDEALNVLVGALKRNVLELSAYISSLEMDSDCVDVMKKWSSHFKNMKLQLDNVRGPIFNLEYAADY